ncbi:DUF6119 family protein [Micromonospora sp. NPDC051196]|uniref:DUF6119 family protein n=1 Tax=Micromonospora sp. NPDC051196 TaxID=3155281 RepID=UPI00342AFCFB
MDLVLFKVRDDLDEGDWGLRRVIDDEYEEVAVKSIPGVELGLHIKTSKESVPRWQEDLMLIAKEQDSPLIRGLRNQSSGAVVRIGRCGHRFLLVYGTGRHAVESTKIEARFGLQVAANLIDPEALKGVDTRRLVGAGRNQIISMASVGPLHKLGIEPTVDIVRQLEGRPPEGFATGIIGGDTLRLTLNSFRFGDLPIKLDEIIAAYNSDAYKGTFPFLDYFTRISRSNATLHSRLNSRIDEMILSKSHEVDFMEPETDATVKPDRFVLKLGRRSVPIEGELNREVVTKAVSEGV